MYHLLGQQDRCLENAAVSLQFYHTAVGLNDMGNGTQSKALAMCLGGQIFTGFGFAQGTGIGVGYLKVHSTHAMLSPDNDLLFSCRDLSAGIQRIFQQIADDHRQCRFRKGNGFGQLNENVDLSALEPAVDFYKYIITEA